MGIRFACHGCGKRLNIKAELAGRRGICPDCEIRFRIPLHDATTSTPLDDQISDDSSVSLDENSNATRSTNAARSANATQLASAAGNSAVTAIQSRGGTATASRPAMGQPASTPKSTSAKVADSGASESIFGGITTTWYVRPPSGGQYGPANGPTMRQWLGEGRVAESSMVWRDGWPEWQNAKIAFIAEPDAPWSTAGPSTAGPSTAPPTVNAQPLPTSVAAQRVVASPVAGGVDARSPVSSNHNSRARKRTLATVVLLLVFAGLVAGFVVLLNR